MSIFNITPSDFTGEFAIAGDQFTDTVLQSYIDEMEVTLCYDLLGVELADLLIADLSGGLPQTPIYQAIFDPFAEDVSTAVYTFFWWSGGYSVEFFDYCCFGRRDKNYYESKGLLYYLKVMIWFNFTRDYVGIPAIQGNVRRESTNSENVSYNSVWVAKKHQKGVTTARAIQWYCVENESDYPTFKGSRIDDIIPL